VRLSLGLIAVLSSGAFLSSRAQGQTSEFSGSCQVHGPYGAGCIEFYDGTWTEEQMLHICRAVSGRRVEPTLDYHHKCERDNYARLCVSQQLFSIAYVYIDRFDQLSCHGILNGKLYQRPNTGW
jgi:hypothetical protein